MSLILVASAWPGQDRPFTEGGWDKLYHAVADAVLAAFLFQLCRTSCPRPESASCAGLAAIAAAAYGLLIELFQLLIPGRDFQWGDVAANSGGVALGLLVLLYLYRRYTRQGPANVADPADK